MSSVSAGDGLSSAEEVIRHLGLEPHPEGGHYRETFRDAPGPQGRAHCTAIYFLLTEGEVSRWHRIDVIEIWHWYAGAPMEISIAVEGHDITRHRLGAGLHLGHQPQVIIPARAWQSARSLGAWSLVGCTVAPGFEFEHFELAPTGWEP